MPESERQKCGTDAAPQSVHKGLGDGDREFVLLIKKIDFFDKLKPQILLRFLFIWYGLTSPSNYCILLLDFFRRLWYNNKVFCIEPVIMGVSPVQGSSVNHVRRGTEQH